MLVGPQESGKTVLHQAIGSLFPADSVFVSRNSRQHFAQMMKGTRILNVFENPETHYLYHGVRHEKTIGQALSIQGSRSHWIETAHHSYMAGSEPPGIWLKTVSLEPLKRPMPDISKRLEDERDQFLQSLHECNMLDSLERIPVNYASLLRRIA